MTKVQKFNDLFYRASRTVGEEEITVTIRLNDECKNGHQDFAIIADIYKAGKPHTDRNLIACGCLHDEILMAFPEFKIFVSLHLCDLEGVPMYAVENGYYHLREGFNKENPTDPNFKQKYCEYYRITPGQFDELFKAQSKTQFAIKLKDLGILTQWKEEAEKAINILQELTGKEFLPDSAKSNYHAPTDEEIKEEEKRQKEGYYTPEAARQRELSAQAEIIKKLAAERDADITNANNEFEVKKQVLEIGGRKALDNCIYYNHTKTISFNWRDYDKIPEELISKIKAEIHLPDGVTFHKDK